MITRRISNEQELTLVSEFDVEPTALSLSNNLPPQDVDVASLVLPSFSCTNSFCISQNDRSFHSSIDGQNDQHVTYIIL